MSGGWSGGVFSLSVDMSANDAAGIPIVSSAFSNQSDEIKDGINACLTKDGTNSPSADLPMATKKHTNVGAAVAITQYIRAHEYITQNPIYMRDQDTGSTISVSCSTLYWPTSAVDGMIARIRMGATKPVSSAAQIEIVINGVTMSAVMPNGDDIVPGALVSAQVHDFIYDGTTSKFRLLNPAVSLKRYAVVWKCRAAADASVTVSTGATMTIAAGVFGDVAYIFKDDFANRNMTFGASTGAGLVWSAPPSYLMPEEQFYSATLNILTSSDAGTTNKDSYIGFIPSSNRIVIAPNDGAVLGSAASFKPFSVTYIRKRTL